MKDDDIGHVKVWRNHASGKFFVTVEHSNGEVSRSNGDFDTREEAELLVSTLIGKPH